MAGFQEILIVVAIVLGIFFIPRMVSKRPVPRPADPKPKLSGNLRIGIAATIVYPIIPAVYFQPWRGNLALFMLIGILPVVLGWLVIWVVAGFRKP